MNIQLSPNHGVNPTMGICMYCKREDGSVSLLGRLPGDAEAERYSIVSDEPCDACKELMKQGVMLVEVLEMKEIYQRPARGKPKERMKFPVTSGTLCVVSDDFINRVIQPEELRNQILEKRMSFVTPEDWDAIGLPREDKDYREEANEDEDGEKGTSPG